MQLPSQGGQRTLPFSEASRPLDLRRTGSETGPRFVLCPLVYCKAHLPGATLLRLLRHLSCRPQATTPELYARGTRATAGLRPLPAARLAKPVAAVLYHDGFARELNEACVGGGRNHPLTTRSYARSWRPVIFCYDRTSTALASVRRSSSTCLIMSGPCGPPKLTTYSQAPMMSAASTLDSLASAPLSCGQNRAAGWTHSWTSSSSPCLSIIHLVA